MRPVIEEYIRIVKDKSLLRKLMLICSAAIARAADQSETALEVIGAAETALLEVSEKGVTGGLGAAGTALSQTRLAPSTISTATAATVTGLETDFTKLDEMTSGLQKGELIIVAARPSMGKTAFAINMAQNAAVNHNAIVAVFSLEMNKESLLRRMLSSQAWVDQRNLANRLSFAKKTTTSCVRGLEALVESRLFIDDTAGISLAEMRAKARRLKQTYGASILLLWTICN